jgi:Type I phosphodiesterase / nucleotide pyrophosphatase
MTIQRVERARRPQLAGALPIVLSLPLSIDADQSDSRRINRSEHRDTPHVLLNSLDGFKADYLDLFELPHLQRIDAEINGVRPTISTRYSSGVPNDTRVDTVLDWLRVLSDQRPHMITLYFSELDSAQYSGPLDAAAAERAAKSLDSTIGWLVAPPAIVC